MNKKYEKDFAEETLRMDSSAFNLSEENQKKIEDWSSDFVKGIYSNACSGVFDSSKPIPIDNDSVNDALKILNENNISAYDVCDEFFKTLELIDKDELPSNIKSNFTELLEPMIKQYYVSQSQYEAYRKSEDISEF